MIRARARGVGPAKRISGELRYHLFEVRVCAINYLEGGTKVSAHLLWHTGVNRPDLRKKMAALRKEALRLRALIVSGQATPEQTQRAQQVASQIERLQSMLAGLQPYAEDWKARGHGPIMHTGCRSVA